MKSLYLFLSAVVVAVCTLLTRLTPVADETWSIIFEFAGTLHPMLLHLPIGLWFGVVCILAVGTKVPTLNVTPWLFWGSVLTLGSGFLSFITGLMLYLSGMYTDSMIRPHMYGALAFIIGVAVFGAFVRRAAGFRILWPLAILVSAALGFAGHKGGVITHGDPMEKAPWVILAEDPE